MCRRATVAGNELLFSMLKHMLARRHFLPSALLQLLRHADLCENSRLHQSDLAPLLNLASTGDEGVAA
jgi:hypothetical protein